MRRLVRRASLPVLLGVALLCTAVVPGSSAFADPGGDVPEAWHDDQVRARDDARVRAMLQRMTLEEKVGQLFVVQFYGHRADASDQDSVAANRRLYGVDNAAQLIDAYPVGGVIYYADNLDNPKQIAKLSNGIQRAGMRGRPRIPLMIGADQEQGVVTRIGPPATEFPGNMALGAGRRPADATAAAHVTGAELRAMGINQDYAPVADVNVNPQNPVIGVRSFGSDPALVAEMTAAATDGYQGGKVAATAKHFPGHGDTDVDSHTGIPIINHTREEWQRIDEPPFGAAIGSGVDSIMTAHIVVPALDPSEDPATLSQPIMNGILREEMGYDGVVVTDALDMDGVREKYGDDEVPVLALKAGVDQLLKPPDGKFEQQYNAVLEAVRSGEISERRLDQSVERILRLKQRLGLFANPYVDPERVSQTVGNRDHRATAQRITDRTVTLVKDEAGLLPLRPGGDRSVLVTGWGGATTEGLGARIAERGARTDVYPTGDAPTQEEIDAAVERAKAHDVTVVTTNRVRGDAQQAKLVRALVAAGVPVVAVAVRDPYDIAHITEVPAYLATYSYTGVSLESVTRVLFGEVSPRGRLPVSIPAADDPDRVLYPYGHGLGY
ncbi:MAG: glycoside hydrolase family 3 protein [Streptosporangiales bacterium]|nr:glycoside hydrolase family 3 protein [Streptosporangiales bacterium]